MDEQFKLPPSFLDDLLNDMAEVKPPEINMVLPFEKQEKLQGMINKVYSEGDMGLSSNIDSAREEIINLCRQGYNVNEYASKLNDVAEDMGL